MPSDPPARRPRERLVIEIDPHLLERLRTDRVRTRRPVNRIVEEILEHHYRTKPPVLSGQSWARVDHEEDA